MAENKDIGFKLEINGVEKSISSIKDLKGAIKDLQDVAENSDIGSEQYKQAVEDLDKLNNQLKEVTQTEKQAAKAAEDLAKAEKEAAKETGDLRKQFETLEDELFMLAGQGKQNTAEFRALSNEAAKLNKRIDEVNKSLEGTSSTKTAEGLQSIGGGLNSIKEGLLELDFGKVKEGLTAAKQGFVLFGQGAKTALQGVKSALIATGIGALVVALGLIVAYWDDIKALVTGVSEEQKKLNEAAKENYETENKKLKSLSSQDNILKSQGLTEKQILDLKLKQTDEVIKAAEASLELTIQTQKAEQAAAQRSKTILSGLVNFISLPLTALLRGIDGIGKALGKNFGLMESFQTSITDLILGSDAELEKKQQAEIQSQRDTIADLKNQRAGYANSINKIDEDARKEANETARANGEKKLADEKKLLDDIQKERLASMKDRDAAAYMQLELDKKRAIEEINATKASDEIKEQARFSIKQDYIAKVEALDKQIADKKQAEEDKLKADEEAKRLADLEKEKKFQDELLAIAKEKEAKRLAQEKAAEDARFQIAQNSINSLQGLSDMYFLFKTKNLEKGSAEELKQAKRQFDINKGLQIASATIAGIQGVQNALSATSILPEPLATAFRISNAIAVGVASAANIAKIAASQFSVGGGASGGGGAATPASAPIPSPPTVNTPGANVEGTRFDQEGNKINNNQTPMIQVNATVGVDEITAKSNRVQVLENQSKF